MKTADAIRGNYGCGTITRTSGDPIGRNIAYTYILMQHLIETQQFDREALNRLFKLANKLEKKSDDSLKGKILAALFYESSTRTRLSFESAMMRLGGNV